jgi:hypothetical protein
MHVSDIFGLDREFLVCYILSPSQLETEKDKLHWTCNVMAIRPCSFELMSQILFHGLLILFFSHNKTT